MTHQQWHITRYIKFIFTQSEKDIRTRFTLAILGTASSAVLIALSPIFLQHTTDSLIKKEDFPFWLLIYILCLAAGKVLTLYGSLICRDAVERLSVFIGGKILQSTIVHSKNSSEKNPTEWVQHLLSAKNNNAAILFSGITVVLPLAARLTLSTITLVLYKDYVTSALIIAYMTCCILLNAKKIRHISTQYAAAIASSTNTSRVLSGLFSNLDTIKIFKSQDLALKEFTTAGEEQLHRHQAVLKSNNAIDITNATIFISILFATLFVSSQKVLSGETTVGYFIMVNALVYQVCQPLEGLLRVIASISDSATSLKTQIRELNILGLLKSDKTHSQYTPNDYLPPSIVMESAHFKYSDQNTHVFQPLSFSFCSAGVIVVIGPSGAGKSSLLKLLCGYEKPEEGKILINGRDTSQLNQAEIFDHICLVQQDPQLFNNTLRFNLAIANPDANDSEIISALKSCYLEDWFKSLPEGLDTIIGERGSKMSGGEKQRLSLARGLLRNRSIFLIDEITSGLDHVTEENILAMLRDFSNEKIIVFVTHRSSSLSIANKVLILEPGKNPVFEDIDNAKIANDYVRKFTRSNDRRAVVSR